ncbi:hypothetical protein D918_07440, partial [Trichuris suis]
SSSINDNKCGSIEGADPAQVPHSCYFESVASHTLNVSSPVNINLATCASNVNIDLGSTPKSTLSVESADGKNDCNESLNDSQGLTAGTVSPGLMRHSDLTFDRSKVVFCGEDEELNISSINLGFNFDPFGESFDQLSENSSASVCCEPCPTNKHDVLGSPILKKRNSLSCFVNDESVPVGSIVEDEDEDEECEHVKHDSRYRTAHENKMRRSRRSSFILSQADVSVHSDVCVSTDEEEDSSECVSFDSSFVDLCSDTENGSTISKFFDHDVGFQEW